MALLPAAAEMVIVFSCRGMLPAAQEPGLCGNVGTRTGFASGGCFASGQLETRFGVTFLGVRVVCRRWSLPRTFAARSFGIG